MESSLKLAIWIVALGRFWKLRGCSSNRSEWSRPRRRHPSRPAEAARRLSPTPPFLRFPRFITVLQEHQPELHWLPRGHRSCCTTRRCHPRPAGAHCACTPPRQLSGRLERALISAETLTPGSHHPSHPAGACNSNPRRSLPRISSHMTGMNDGAGGQGTGRPVASTQGSPLALTPATTDPSLTFLTQTSAQPSSFARK